MLIDEALSLLPWEIEAALPTENFCCSLCQTCWGCFHCANCLQCIDCISCVGCIDCTRCAYCTNLRGLTYVIRGKQYTADLYYKVLRLITGPADPWENWKHDCMLG